MDARHFFRLAVERGFVAPALLIGAEATGAAVRAKLAEMAAVSEPGDLFLLTFSGHGGRTRLASGEVGTWQLYDGTLNEQQLVHDLSRFQRGVRVLIVSDNCGGGLPRSPQSPGGSERSVAARLAPSRSRRVTSQRSSAPAVAPVAGESRCLRSSPGSPPSRPAIEGVLKSSVLVLAACQPGQYADGEGLPGHFAAAIDRTLTGFRGTYAAFHQTLANEMPSYQKPDFYRLGEPSGAFESQQPFAI